MRDQAAEFVHGVQDRITHALAAVDGGSFLEDNWERPGGGGGRTRVLDDGRVFEKAGVNVSVVHGELSEDFAKSLPGDGREFFATGISLVLHPRNPRAPTVHANFRYIEQGSRRWFGGGADLTPYYLFEEDAVWFHRVWKRACDQHSSKYYPRFKEECDRYFFLPHRGEARGVGGIFFDYLDANAEHESFWRTAADAFLDAYLPIIERRKDLEYTERERLHQLQRRGRYVEFNLVYDRGTLFGLKTDGRIESILMSLPPLVRWDYDAAPQPGTPEAELLEVLRQPRDWLAGSREES